MATPDADAGGIGPGIEDPIPEMLFDALLDQAVREFGVSS